MRREQRDGNYARESADPELLHVSQNRTISKSRRRPLNIPDSDDNSILRSEHFRSYR